MPKMRFAAYAGTSVALATGVIFRALHSRANFYSACVYLSQSNACLMILSNLLLLVVGSLLLGLQRLLYGPLRPIEIEQLYEKAWFAVTETCLAMTIFRDEVGAWFVVMFVSLLVGKVWGWIGEGRVEILEQQPPANPRLFHARLSTSLAASLLFDAYLLRYSIVTVQQQARPNMMVMFAFEFAVLSVNCLSTCLRYVISLREAAVIREQTSSMLQQRREEILRQREEATRTAEAAGEQVVEEVPIEEVLDEANIEAPGWEAKSRWVFYLDLATDFVKLFLYLSFFCVLCMFYGMPIHIIRDVALTIRSFYKRITDFLRYRHATRNMNERYPDATEEDIQTQDVCIICREGMRTWQRPSAEDAGGEGTANPADDRLRPKKLPCGHILHFACLRSWLERQQNCPTCRQPVLSPTPISPVPQRAAGQGLAGQANVPAAQNRGFNGHGRPAEQNRVRFFNLGPLRLGFGAGHDLRGLEQQIENEQARQRIGRNNDDAQQFGFSFGLGRSQQGITSPEDVASRNIQTQLQLFEQQLMVDINSLRLQHEQLQTVRALQGELARLRIANASTSALRPTSLTDSAQLHPPYHNNAPGNIPQAQLFVPAPGTNDRQQRLNSGDPQLPPGVTIPEGWTLLPLQQLQGLGTTSGNSQGSSLNDSGLPAAVASVPHAGPASEQQSTELPAERSGVESVSHSALGTSQLVSTARDSSPEQSGNRPLDETPPTSDSSNAVDSFEERSSSTSEKEETVRKDWAVTIEDAEDRDFGH